MPKLRLKMVADGSAQLVDDENNIVAVGAVLADAEVARGGGVVTSLRFVGQATADEEDDPLGVDA